MTVCNFHYVYLSCIFHIFWHIFCSTPSRKKPREITPSTNREPWAVWTFHTTGAVRVRPHPVQHEECRNLGFWPISDLRYDRDARGGCCKIHRSRILMRTIAILAAAAVFFFLLWISNCPTRLVRFLQRYKDSGTVTGGLLGKFCYNLSWYFYLTFK